ncbi:DNA gyrase inhibitor YacG [Allohahella marinimesophila]|uniref:DNA gyrase inhibitor YacG n=1 Tax=Allohahella marinimesophila TaxID=1054972 RepID=A0ABP7Q1G0_9GAMM
MKTITVNCPTCQKPVKYIPENEFRPFCCERCQMIDLGAWAEESYKIPVTPTAEDLDHLMDELDGQDESSDDRDSKQSNGYRWQ